MFRFIKFCIQGEWRHKQTNPAVDEILRHQIDVGVVMWRLWFISIDDCCRNHLARVDLAPNVCISSTVVAVVLLRAPVTRHNIIDIDNSNEVKLFDKL